MGSADFPKDGLPRSSSVCLSPDLPVSSSFDSNLLCDWVGRSGQRAKPDLEIVADRDELESKINMPPAMTSLVVVSKMSTQEGRGTIAGAACHGVKNSSFPS